MPTEGTPHDRRAERHLQERAEPERGAAVPELVVHARSASSSSSTSAALRSLHPLAKEKPGRKPLKDIKTLKEDAVAVEKQSDEIKKRYSQICSRCLTRSRSMRTHARGTHANHSPDATFSRAAPRSPRPRCSPSRSAPRRRPRQAITPALIEAAKKEGKLAFYTAMDLDFAQRLGKAFEAKYGIAVRVERSGAERVFTRIGQEYTANIRAGRRRQHRRRRALHRLDAQRLARALPAGGGRQALRQGTTTIRTGCTSRRASWSRRSPTTPTW